MGTDGGLHDVMIRRFNRGLETKAAWATVASVLGYIVGFLLLGWLIAGIGGDDIPGVAGGMAYVLAAVFLGLLTLCGWPLWREDAGFDRLVDLGRKMPPVFKQYQQASVLRFFIKQLLFAGPVMAARAVSYMKARLPADEETRRSVSALLEEVRARGSWHAVEEWAGREKELSALIHMGQVDFAPVKGRVKAVDPEDS